MHKKLMDNNALTEYNQWVIVKYDGTNESKLPRGKTGAVINAHESEHWMTYKDACKLVDEGAATNVGFVFTAQDPFVVLDLDNKTNDADRAAHIDTIVNMATEAGHYIETSVSGYGKHIIFKGKKSSAGTRADWVEYYSDGRYIIITGDGNGNPIIEDQGLADVYNSRVDKKKVINLPLQENPREFSDQDVLDKMFAAVNGPQSYQLFHDEVDVLSQNKSEEDQSLIERLCFYSKNCFEQVRILFKQSARGKRMKVIMRGDEYIDRCIQYSVNVNQVPEIEIDLTAMKEAITGEAMPPDLPGAQVPHEDLDFPPGFVGLMAQYFYVNSVQPIKSFAIANALSTMAGVVGRNFSFRGSTINLFSLIIGRSGSGKDASRRPLHSLMTHLNEEQIFLGQFIGPEAASGQALFSTLEDQPCYSVYTGELADDLLMISNSKASDNNRTMLNAYLRLYDEQQFGGKVHRDSKNNVKAVTRPSVTIMGSGTPDFFEHIDDHAVKRGLLPRFIILEHTGKTPPFNDNEYSPPHPKIMNGIHAVMKAVAADRVIDVSYESEELRRQSMQYRNDIVRRQDEAPTIIEQELYNRVHLNICRVASVLSACNNPHNPVITKDTLEWAHSYLMHSLDNLISKYRKGELGGNTSVMQEAELLSMFVKWYEMTPLKRGAYSKELMDTSLFVPFRFITARAKMLNCFTKDSKGLDRALKDALLNLEMTDQIMQLTPKQKEEHKLKSRSVYARRGKV